jgi:hypothetical protein
MPSKLCPHTLNAHPDTLAMVEAGSPLVKLVNDFGLAERLLALNPQLIIVGRVFSEYNPDEKAKQEADPVAEARAWMTHYQAQYQLNPLIKLWEGPNEPVFGDAHNPTSASGVAWYAQFEAERVRLLAALGLRAVVGNFATGTLDLPLWPGFLPALRAAHEHGGMLGVHEYSSPWMWWLTGAYQTQNCPDQFATGPGEGDEGWLTLRYRKVYRQHLIPHGLGALPLVITENGLDATGDACEPNTSGPWKTHFDFWNRYDGRFDPIDYWRGPERDPEKYYAEQLMWYDGELQKDAFVMGATLFSVGVTGGWQSFDVGGSRVIQHLLPYLRAEKARTPPPPVPPVIHPPASINLLSNGNFEEGLAYTTDDAPTFAIPSGWLGEVKPSTTPRLARQTQAFGQPTAALLKRAEVSPAEQNRLFSSGDYVWRVMAPQTPIWARLFQGVSGLALGQRYRLTLNFLPDPKLRDQPTVAYTTDTNTSEARLVIESGGRIFEGDWQNLAATPAGRYTRLTLEFAAPDPKAIVAFELRARAALPLGAWYVDEARLEPLGA